MSRLNVLCATLITILYFCDVVKAETPIEVQTFWRSIGERRAFQELVRHGRNAGLHIEPVLMDSYAQLREQTSRRLAIGIPPEVSHWIGGADQQLLAQSGNLLPVPQTVADLKIENVLFEEVLTEITSNGVPYGIPVGIHLQTIVVYNKKLLAQVGVTEFPETWPALFELTEKLESADITPLAGSSHFWLLQGLLDTALIGVGGRTAFEDFYGRPFNSSGTLQPKLNEAIEILWKFRDMVDEGHVDRYWADMVNMVINDQAAFTFIGDYAWSEIAVNAPDRLDDFGCAAPPNTHVAHFAVDIFVGFETGSQTWRETFPKLFEIVVSPQTQIDYLAFKGGLPVSKLVSTTNLNHCSESSLNLWLNATEGRLPPLDARDTAQLAGLVDVLIEAWFDEDLSPTDASQLIFDRVKMLSGK